MGPVSRARRGRRGIRRRLPDVLHLASSGRRSRRPRRRDPDGACSHRARGQRTVPRTRLPAAAAPSVRRGSLGGGWPDGGMTATTAPVGRCGGTGLDRLRKPPRSMVATQPSRRATTPLTSRPTPRSAVASPAVGHHRGDAGWLTCAAWPRASRRPARFDYSGESTWASDRRIFVSAWTFSMR